MNASKKITVVSKAGIYLTIGKQGISGEYSDSPYGKNYSDIYCFRTCKFVLITTFKCFIFKQSTGKEVYISLYLLNNAIINVNLQHSRLSRILDSASIGGCAAKTRESQKIFCKSCRNAISQYSESIYKERNLIHINTLTIILS